MTDSQTPKGPKDEQESFNQRLLSFLGDSPTPFHAVENIATVLRTQGFEYLNEQDQWQPKPGGRYFTTRNGSSIIAFNVGTAPLLENGMRLVGAHTDSPCLTIKPQPELHNQGYFKLGVEVYGGALLNPWFDRDLSIAGRLLYRTSEGLLKQAIVDFKKPVAVIPSLAIHLDRKANEGRTINPQLDIPPIIFQNADDRCKTFSELLAKQFLENTDACAEVVDYDLYLYDTQKPVLVGVYQDFIASARLDNLLSCFIGLEAMLSSNTEQTTVLVCNDHEEVGSASICGAQGPMLASVLERLIPNEEERTRIISRSLFVSADNAHGIHPNYASKHDQNHGPLLNAGPVIKVNTRQRYATSSVTAALFKQLAHEVEVPLQSFVTRTDMGCGSTIGPLTASGLGVPTLDVGVPTFAMHSIRELAGARDGYLLSKILAHFYQKSGSMCIETSTLQAVFR